MRAATSPASKYVSNTGSLLVLPAMIPYCFRNSWQETGLNLCCLTRRLIIMDQGSTVSSVIRHCQLPKAVPGIFIRAELSKPRMSCMGTITFWQGVESAI